MTLDDVAKRVQNIRDARDDDEAAHEMEDKLRADLLTAIANGSCEHPRECARAALAASEIDFARWCA